MAPLQPPQEKRLCDSNCLVSPVLQSGVPGPDMLGESLRRSHEFDSRFEPFHAARLSLVVVSSMCE